MKLIWDFNMKKAIVISGKSIDRLHELKKEYQVNNNRKITYDLIISKLILKAKVSDLSK